MLKIKYLLHSKDSFPNLSTKLVQNKPLHLTSYTSHHFKHMEYEDMLTHILQDDCFLPIRRALSNVKDGFFKEYFLEEAQDFIML